MDLLLSTTRPYIKPGTNGATISTIYNGRGLARRQMSYNATLGLGVALINGLAGTSCLSYEQVVAVLPGLAIKDLQAANVRFKREQRMAARSGNGHNHDAEHNGRGNGNSETPVPITIVEADPVEVENAFVDAIFPDTEVTVEDTPVTATITKTEVIAPVSDIPEVRISIRRLAASLGCSITQLDEQTISVFDCGPYALIDNASGDRVWHCGLPLQGILDALHRLARERHLSAEQKGEAWIGFGLAWRK